MSTFTFYQISFEPHGSGDGGFEGEIYFPNNFQVKIVCGPLSFLGGDPTLRDSAEAYDVFEYWEHKPIDYLPPTIENWVGPMSKADLITALQAISDRPYQVGWEPGGMGEN